MLGLAMRVSELLRDRGVVVGIATTPQRQYGDDRLVSLLGCCGLIDCGLVISEDGI